MLHVTFNRLFIYIYLNMMTKTMAIKKTAIPTAAPDRKGTRNEDFAEIKREAVLLTLQKPNDKDKHNPCYCHGYQLAPWLACLMLFIIFVLMDRHS